MPASTIFLVGKQDEAGEYGLPSGMSLTTLNGWFEQHLPPNHPWRHWSWCRISDTHGPGAGSIVWSWKMDGSLLELAATSIAGRSRFTEALQKQLVVCS